MTDKPNPHPETNECGFDRNGSHNAGHYVCMCGWEDKPNAALDKEEGAEEQREIDMPFSGSMEYKK